MKLWKSFFTAPGTNITQRIADISRPKLKMSSSGLQSCRQINLQTFGRLTIDELEIVIIQLLLRRTQPQTKCLILRILAGPRLKILSNICRTLSFMN